MEQTKVTEKPKPTHLTFADVNAGEVFRDGYRSDKLYMKGEGQGCEPGFGVSVSGGHVKVFHPKCPVSLLVGEFVVEREVKFKEEVPA